MCISLCSWVFDTSNEVRILTDLAIVSETPGEVYQGILENTFLPDKKEKQYHTPLLRTKSHEEMIYVGLRGYPVTKVADNADDSRVKDGRFLTRSMTVWARLSAWAPV